MRAFYRRLVKFLGSRTFFLVVVLVFLASALWIAFSARYPMAFDEDYHLGLIRLHALQWNPIFTHQPAGVAEFGALTKDPSYLFHWLMSFPYRVLDAMHVSQMVMVLTLRVINIGMFAISLFVLRRLLMKTKVEPAAIHIALLFYVLTPAVPLLAATINYDNFQNILIASALLLTIRFRDKLYERKQFDIKALAGALVISMLGCLVKFTFLPIFTAIAVYMFYLIIRFHRHKLLKAANKAWRALPSPRKWAITAAFVISFGLFMNTYAVNIIQYQNPIPQCGQVLDVQRCSAYRPWYRNYLAALNNKGVNPNPLPFTGSWIGGMFNRLFFTINGHGAKADNSNSLAPVMAATAALLTIFGVYLACLYGPKLLRKDSALAFLLFATLVYFAAVWGRNYHDYIHLGKIVAINGRYLVPMLPFLYVFAAHCYQCFLRGKVRTKMLVLSISIILFLQGGGAISFIHYSTADWYWPGNRTILRINNDAKRVVDPFFIAGLFEKK